MSSETRSTLLQRLREGADAVAWDQFFQRYWRLIYAFARHRGCGEHTAEEMVQEVMLAVFEKRDLLRYDRARGSFRNWLMTVVRNKVADHRRGPAGRDRAQGGSSRKGFSERPCSDAPPDELWQTVFEEALLAALLDVVRREVTSETYQAFELVALHELPARLAAELTGLSRNAVYLARKRVLRRLKDLGADYRDAGNLSDRIRRAMETFPDAAVEHVVTNRMTKTMQTR